MLAPPEHGPGAPPAYADQTQACENCRGPSIPADCAPAGAEVCCALYQVQLRQRAHSSGVHCPPPLVAAVPADAGGVPTGLGLPP
eukprot:15451467-Alexandrium_andersonii.AAC.1